MDKGPKIRIVGGTSEEKKAETRQRIRSNLFNHLASMPENERGDFEKFEYAKYPIEIEMIHLANEETSHLMQEAGMEPYDVPVENIHIIPPELYEKITGTKKAGRTNRVKEVIILNSAYLDSPVAFYSHIVHELLHLKAHLSIEVQETGGVHTDETVYRKGVTVLASQHRERKVGFHKYLEGLHEAIVAETEKRLVLKLLDQSPLKKEKEWQSSEEAVKLKKQIAKESGVSEEDIIWIDAEDKTKFEIGSYNSQRKVLNFVCTEIYKKFGEQFKSVDDVYKLFLNVNFTGQLLPIARLIEKTFGKGSFRLLGNMGTDKESGVWCLELLKETRTHQTTAMI